MSLCDVVRLVVCPWQDPPHPHPTPTSKNIFLTQLFCAFLGETRRDTMLPSILGFLIVSKGELCRSFHLVGIGNIVLELLFELCWVLNFAGFTVCCIKGSVSSVDAWICACVRHIRPESWKRKFQCQETHF